MNNIKNWSDIEVTPEMARVGADQLRRWCYGQDLQAVATAMFCAMQNAAHGAIGEAAHNGEARLPPRIPLDWDG